MSPEDCKFSHDLNNLPPPVEPPRTHNAPPPPLPQVVMPAVQKMDEEPNPDDIPVPEEPPRQEGLPPSDTNAPVFYKGIRICNAAMITENDDIYPKAQQDHDIDTDCEDY